MVAIQVDLLTFFAGCSSNRFSACLSGGFGAVAPAPPDGAALLRPAPSGRIVQYGNLTAGRFEPHDG